MKKNIFKRLIEKIYLSFTDNLVYYDSVTQCRTRFYYDQIIQTRFKKKRCYAVYIDINNLKYVNDHEGHYQGTQLIKRVSNQLLKLKNVLEICRIGGDEFIMICDMNFNEDEIKNVTDISYGITLKETNEDVQTAISRADTEMYKMKNRIKKNR